MNRRKVLSSRFKKNFKRFAFDEAFCAEFDAVVELLAADAPLPPKYRDHALHNDWEGCRDCHVRPDVVLVYRKTADGLELLLLRVGSHSEVFG